MKPNCEQQMTKRIDQLEQFLNKLNKLYNIYDFHDFMINNGFELTIWINYDYYKGITLRINKSKEFRQIREYISFSS